MSLSILNNVAALYAQNNINATQSKLQSTLQQLSSGSRINSGADDPSGLAVADGMTANISALAQSATNATSGIGLLQTADGALSQVTSLLNQAVTLATEASNGTLTGNQVSSANQEYQNILTQIGNVGAHTNFNSNSVFTNSSVNVAVTDGTSSGLNQYSETVGALSTASVGTTVGSATAQVGGVTTNVTTPVTAVGSTTAATATFTFSSASATVGGSVAFMMNTQAVSLTVESGSTLGTAVTQMNTQLTAANAGVTATTTGATIVFTANTIVAGDTMAPTVAKLADTTPITTQASSTTGVGADFTQSAVATLTSTSAAAVLTTVTAAVNDVAYQRGTLGGEINQLSSAAGVASAESVNLASASNAVTATDYGAAASNLSKYQILSQTGISALAQANSVQQEVLKLLQ